MHLKHTVVALALAATGNALPVVPDQPLDQQQPTQQLDQTPPPASLSARQQSQGGSGQGPDGQRSGNVARTKIDGMIVSVSGSGAQPLSVDEEMRGGGGARGGGAARFGGSGPGNSGNDGDRNNGGIGHLIRSLISSSSSSSPVSDNDDFVVGQQAEEMCNSPNCPHGSRGPDSNGGKSHSPTHPCV